MSALVQIALALGSVAVLIGLMVLVRRVATAWGWEAELQRKLVHIGTGLYAITLPWLFPDRWPVFMLLGITLVVMLILRLPGLAQSGVGAALHGVERNSYGDLLLALAVGVVFLLADQPVVYVLPLAILTLSDSAAALTGSTYGRRFFTVEDGRKSIEGSVAFFMTSFCLGMICLLALSETDRITVIYLAAIVAAFGTLVEADSWRGFDNFFLPAGLMLFLQGHLETPPGTLLALMAGFLAAIWIALRVARLVRVPAHTARVYVIAAFLVLTVVDVPNAVLPVLVFATHLISQQRNPDTSPFGELDCVAAVALMSFFWLTLGRVSGAYNLELYGLTALGMSVGFLSLTRPWLGVLAAVAGAGLYIRLMAGNASANAIEVDPLGLGIGAALAAAVPALWPGWFARMRAARVAALALTVPVALFALKIIGDLICGIA